MIARALLNELVDGAVASGAAAYDAAAAHYSIGLAAEVSLAKGDKLEAAEEAALRLAVDVGIAAICAEADVFNKVANGRSAPGLDAARGVAEAITQGARDALLEMHDQVWPPERRSELVRAYRDRLLAALDLYARSLQLICEEESDS